MGEGYEDEKEDEQVDAGTSSGSSDVFGNYNNRSRNSGIGKGLKNFFGGLAKNIAGALRGDARHIFMLKAKLIILAVGIVLIVVALIAAVVAGVAISTSQTATASVSSTFENGTTPAAVEFNKSGSLILASDDELKEINDNFMKSIQNKNRSYYDSFLIKYSGKTSSSVANRVTHITTNYEAVETAEVNKITDTVVNVAGAASLSEERPIFEHIIRAEKYNFNNIIWRSYVKSGSDLKQESMSFTVDSTSKLKYPSSDSNDTDNATHDLSFFITKTRSYLQSWYIPFDMATSLEGQSSEEMNTKLAYEIMASAYHEIVMDRYKVETLTRTINYYIYDKTITTKTHTRKCADYEIKADDDTVITQTYCIDDKTTDVKEEKDIRESAGISKDAENTKYRWDYVISQAKLFDNVIANEYTFKAFYKYATTNFTNFINKAGNYKNMTVESYQESEKTNSQADSLSHTSEDYYKKETKFINKPVDWNNSNVVETIPDGAVKVEGSDITRVIEKTEETVKNGKEYEDIYVWQDQLNFTATKSGIYDVQSVKDVTGDDLSESDQKYYQSLYAAQEINLIDLMNSDKNIYSNYLSTETMSASTENIGIRKEKLTLSYSVLKNDLSKLLDNHNFNPIRYGASLGLDINSFAILSGLNFGDMANIAAGKMEGYNVAYPIAGEDLKYAYLQVAKKFGQSYGYEGHGGVDISYLYAKADMSLCTDYSNVTCPYVRGPAIYSTMDGIIKEVGYCPHNKYYDVGINEGYYKDGNLTVDTVSGWGSYVKIENADGSGIIYSHLFPDRDFLKQMSDAIGQPISAGTFVGYMGNTGNSTGLHLHIEFGESVYKLGGGRTSNSSLTYVYLMKIIDVMKINPIIV